MPSVPRLLVAVMLIGGSLGGTQAVPAQPASSLPPGSKTESDTVDLSPTGTVEIDNQKGSITVTTWTRPEIGYRAALSPSAEDSVVATDLDVDHSGEELSFDHDHSWSLRIPGLLTISPDGTSEPIGHFWVVMPETAGLEIDDHASTIEVSGVQGNVNIDTHSGTATVEAIGGNLRLETFSSSATASGLQGRTEIETRSGGITAVFEEFAGPSSAETHSGDLRFYLPADTGLTVATDADTSQFVIDEAFGTPSRDDDRWTLNGGGADLSLETFSGTIELRPLSAYPADR
ncbi:MAG: DUF4097 family beta strand repeat-containing protein [Salinibacter sp.]|uniref:DUF4097 family beta strand repeat-containing protein n=1 Tax=Salinibacter sp. TaxID=2065818 RepID=UPI002FC3A146